MNEFSRFVPIAKVDAEQRMVYGYASTEALDSQKEIVKLSAIEAALPDYMKFANVREMHQPSAVGVTKSATVDGKGVYIGAKIVDDAAWAKVTGEVYKGFSIGGSTVRKVGNVIEELQLFEISLVDRPANPEARIEVWKRAADDADITKGEKEIEVNATKEEADAVSQLAELLNKGTVKAGDVLKAAQALTKADAAADPQAPGEGAGEVTAPASAQPASAPVQKGMWQVSRFAECLAAIGSMAMDAKDEAMFEGDGSPVPAAMRDWLGKGAEILSAMAAEEVGEMIAALNKMRGAGNVSKLEAAPNAEFKKALDTAMAELQKMTESNLALAKRLEAIEKQPAPSRIRLRVVEKGDEYQPPEGAQQDVRKLADDPNTTALDLIKAQHKNGPVPLFKIGVPTRR